MRPEYVLPSQVGAVDLRPVPPERPIGQECRRPRWASSRARVIRQSLVDFHRIVNSLRPVITRIKGHLVAGMRGARVCNMAGPIMNIELNPGGCQQIERGGRSECVPEHELFADLTWS